MILKKTRVALATFMASASMLTMASPAAAYGYCEFDGLTPSAVNVGLSPVTVHYDVDVVGCEELAWKVEIPELFVFAYFIDDGSDPAPASEHRFDPSLMSNSYAGRHDVDVEMYDTDFSEYNEYVYDGFTVTRRTSWGSSFNASPEPVKQGEYIKMSARLTRANWDTDSYTGYAGIRATLQFLPKGSTTWRDYKSVTTDSRGYAKTSVKASKDGTWRLKFAGNSTSGAATSTTDFVDVR